MTAMRIDRVAGVDGVKGGWVMAVTGAMRGSPIEFYVACSFEALLADARARGLLVVAVDIPIGLSAVGRRAADVQAKEWLGGQLQKSVFHAPAHCALAARNEAEAHECNRRAGHRLSPLALSLLPKIREVRSATEPDAYLVGARPRLAEVHPEVSFSRLAEGTMTYFKKRQPGVAERLTALMGEFPNVVEAAVLTAYPGLPSPTHQDLLDAAAAAWTARRIVSGEAACLGEGELDATSYPMHIWV